MISREQGGVALLMMLSLALMVIGFQGSLGVAFAIIFCPSYVELNKG
jgi:hypothetical protein